MSDSPRDPTDERDDAVAARLAVDPLDDVTRARLVRNALAATESAAPGRADASAHTRSRTGWISVAAVVVVLLAVGFAALVNNNPDSAPTASREGAAVRAPETTEPPAVLAVPNAAAATPQSESANQSLAPAVSVQTLGDLGDVGQKAALRRAVASVLAPVEPKAAADQVGALNATTVYRACRPDLGPGQLIATGTGTVDGAAVTIYVMERANGDRVAVAVGAGCKTRTQVPL
jgi:hypothetical protein